MDKNYLTAQSEIPFWDSIVHMYSTGAFLQQHLYFLRLLLLHVLKGDHSQADDALKIL